MVKSFSRCASAVFLIVVLLLATVFNFTSYCINPITQANGDSEGSSVAIGYTHIDNSEQKTLRLGFYQGDPRFQSGFSDDERKSGYGYEFMQSIAAHNNWVFDYFYGTREEVLEALKNGEIDVAAGITDVENASGDYLLSAMDMGLNNAQRYVAFNLNDADLLAQLDEAQAHILETDPEFEEALYEKYYTSDVKSFSLTPHQKQWLANKGTLRFGFVKGSLPISGEASEGGPKGIAELLISEAQEWLDISIETQVYDSIESMYEGLHNEEVDAIFPVFSDPWIAEKNDTVQTQSVISERAMIIFEGEYRNNLTDKIGIYKDGPNQTVFINMNYPNAEIVEYDNRADALHAIFNGEVNCVVGCSSVMQNFLAEYDDEFGSLSSAILPNNENFSVAVRKADGVLATILNAVINTIDDEEVTTTLIRYSSNEQAYSWQEFIRRNAVVVVGILLLLFAIGIALFVLYRHRTKVFNRAQEHSHEMLEEALNAATAANNAKTTFLSNMSHDIRTPMNGIIGMTAIGQANLNDTSKVDDCLEKISISSHHLLNLINDILDMSKIESGEIALNEEIVDLSNLMAELVTLNKPLADAKGHQLITRVIGITHEKVIGDPLRIRQLLTNLIGNSIKYTPEGGRIEMTFEEVPSMDPKRACYKFIISDNGVGMSKEYLPKLFEPFTRESDSASRGGEQGTGLGMAIVRNILHLMGGDISVDSELGEGTTFTVTLYLKPVDEDSLNYDNLAGSRILVVDDDQTVCESVCLLLDEMGVKSDWTLSGRDAVDRIEDAHVHNQAEEYDAVFIDWKMPEMDGVDTTKAIRERVGEDVPLIIISAYDWSDIEQEAIDAGANGFISKPLFKSRLVYLFDSLNAEQKTEDDLTIDDKAKAANLEGTRALLVEDNELNGEIALEILGMSGMQFDWAHNGKEGVEMFEASEPGYYSCVLMDIQMPVMNGLDAAKAIRALDRPDAQTTPIFAMTADAFTEDKQAAIDAGMNEHFAKPLDFDQVFEVIGRYLAK